MKCYTVGNSSVVEGITVSSTPFLHIGLGEDGRGRKYTRVPLGQKDFPEIIEKIDRISILKTRDKQTLLVISEKNTDDNRALIKVEISAGYRGSTTWHLPEDESIKLLAEGYFAQGAAGRMGGHREGLVLMNPGTTLKIERHGRLYGAESERCIRWTGTELQLGTEAELDKLNPENFEKEVKWVPSNFRIKELSGDSVGNGVIFENGKLTRSDYDAEQLLAHGCGIQNEGSVELQKIRFGYHPSGDLVIAPADGELDSDYEIVLIHEYYNGSGAKRWPGFHVDWDQLKADIFIKKLASVHRGKGSGSDDYTLTVLPIGWAENIASQFINERDIADQTIGYDPNFVAPSCNNDIGEQVKRLNLNDLLI